MSAGVCEDLEAERGRRKEKRGARLRIVSTKSVGSTRRLDGLLGRSEGPYPGIRGCIYILLDRNQETLRRLREIGVAAPDDPNSLLWPIEMTQVILS